MPLPARIEQDEQSGIPGNVISPGMRRTIHIADVSYDAIPHPPMRIVDRETLDPVVHTRLKRHHEFRLPGLVARYT
jgi:hypothetical protein